MNPVHPLSSFVRHQKSPGFIPGVNCLKTYFQTNNKHGLTHRTQRAGLIKHKNMSMKRNTREPKYLNYSASYTERQLYKTGMVQYRYGQHGVLTLQERYNYRYVHSGDYFYTSLRRNPRTICDIRCPFLLFTLNHVCIKLHYISDMNRGLPASFKLQ